MTEWLLSVALMLSASQPSQWRRRRNLWSANGNQCPSQRRQRKVKSNIH